MPACVLICRARPHWWVLFSTAVLFFKKESLTEPEAYQFGKIDGQVDPKDSPVSISSAVGITGTGRCAWLLYMGSEGSKGPMAGLKRWLSG